MAKEYSPEQKKLLTTQIYQQIKQNGIRSYSMSQLASDLQISKKTVYKYYHSKKELIAMIVNQFGEDLHSLKLPEVSNFDEVRDIMHQSFERGILIGRTFSDGFISDLENVYPDIYKSYQQNLELFAGRMMKWLEECQANQIIGKQDNELIVLTITQMIPVIQRRYGTKAEAKLIEFEGQMLKTISPEIET